MSWFKRHVKFQLGKVTIRWGCQTQTWTELWISSYWLQWWTQMTNLSHGPQLSLSFFDWRDRKSIILKLVVSFIFFRAEQHLYWHICLHGSRTVAPTYRLYSEAHLPMDEFYRGYIKREYFKYHFMLKFELFKFENVNPIELSLSVEPRSAWSIPLLLAPLVWSA